MADLMSVLQSHYLSAGSNVSVSHSKYVDVDPDKFEGTWSGKYGDNKSFSLSVSDVKGFRAKARYQSEGVVKFQEVLIKDNAFRVGDTKFILAGNNRAQIRTVVTDPVTQQTSLKTAIATQT